MTIFVLSLVVFGARLVAENIVTQRAIETTATPSPSVAPSDMSSDITAITDKYFESSRIVSSDAVVTAFVGFIQNQADPLGTAVEAMNEIILLPGVSTVTLVLSLEDSSPFEPSLSAELIDDGFSASGNQITLNR